jgi:hypothetical protein
MAVSGKLGIKQGRSSLQNWSKAEYITLESREWAKTMETTCEANNLLNPAITFPFIT